MRMPMIARAMPSGAPQVDLEVEVAIIGAGPCGLACANELRRLGCDSWVILEASDHVGGLAASVKDPAGFTWDLGGHVVFSHYGEFDRLVQRIMPEEELLQHDRSSFIRHGSSWIPYPFQQHVRHLPGDVGIDCLLDLIEAQTNPATTGLNTFLEWLTATFGEALTRHFFVPYNTKVWTTSPAEMSATWVADRVAHLDWRTAVRNVITQSDPPAWGPNSTFLFPRHGGTGAIWSRLAATLGAGVRLNTGVIEVDVGGRRMHLTDGTTVRYRQAVSTMPLDRLIATVPTAPAECVAAARELKHSSVYMVGLGYATPVSDSASWRYFPDADVPFYRATNFGKYASANLPSADATRFSSWMTEVAVPAGTRLDQVELADDVDVALRRLGLVAANAPRVSAHIEIIERAYPIPTLGRDPAIQILQDWLGNQDIRSRGRFGTWRYEIGNMDHAVKMGIDAARAIVCDADEECLNAPAGVA